MKYLPTIPMIRSLLLSCTRLVVAAGCDRPVAGAACGGQRAAPEKPFAPALSGKR